MGKRGVLAWPYELAPSRSNYTPVEYYVVTLMVGAKHRCNNKQSASWENYGGRGIKFLFPDVATAAQWIACILGPPPSPNHTIDRIDNNRHYEPGNLRWATKQEQARNKRAYKGSVYGNRMHYLCKMRSDYSYEGLRKYVRLGWTDEQILALKKPGGGRPRKNKRTGKRLHL